MITRIFQSATLKKVNREHLALCWYIGEKIVEKQQLHNWGKSVVENLSKDLQKEFPGTGVLHPDDKKIGWSKDVLIHQTVAYLTKE